MDKCIYCCKEINQPYPVLTENGEDTLTCCSEACSGKTQTFYRYFNRTKRWFFLGLAISIIMLFGSVFLLSSRQMYAGSFLLGGSLLLLGLIVFLFPFASPQTFALLGIKKAVRITRLIGLCVMAISPLLAYWVQT